MTGPRTNEDSREIPAALDGLDGSGGTASCAHTPAEGKLAWRTPALRHLGSVRELTLGATMGMPEGGGTLMVVGM